MESRDGHVAIRSADSQPFVERSKPTISLAEQGKSDVTHIHGKVNEDYITIYGAVLMASESPEVEQKPHDGDNDVTVLADSRALGNYFERQLIPQSPQLSLQQGLQSPSLDFTEDTLDDS